MVGSIRIPGPIVVEIAIALQVTALRRSRLRTLHLIENGHVVLGQVLRRERLLADDQVKVAVLVGAVLDHAALDVANDLADVIGNRAGLRVRHEAAGAEHTTQLSDGGHHVRRCNDGIEVEPPTLDPLAELIVADDVRAGGLCVLGLLALGEHGNSHRLTGPLAGATTRREPSGRACGGRRRDGSRARRSRRTSRRGTP